MLLHIDQSLAQLIRWGLVDSAAIVDGDLAISSVARRNVNLLVERRGGAGYLIKQADPGNPTCRRTLRSERSFYAFCHEEPRASSVRRLMASADASFSEQGVVVIELLAGARPLWQEYRTHPAADFPLGPPRALGRALGTLHATFPLPGLAADPRLDALSEAPPGFLELHRPAPGLQRWLSSAQRRLLRITQAENGICGSLEAAQSTWRVETVIHGDVRSGNVLVVDDGPASAEIRLVDWELARRGDGAWDIADVIKDFACFWLNSMPLEPDLNAAERLALAEYPLAVLQPALRAFWRAYFAAAGLGHAAAGDLLRRAATYSVARILQAAWEQTEDAERLSSLAVLQLQLAANVAADPVRAIHDLFGLAAELTED